MLASARGFQLDHNKFAVTPHGRNLAAGQLQFQRGGIVNEVRLAQTHIQDALARQHRSQTAYYCLNFRQFRHTSPHKKGTTTPKRALESEFIRRCAPCVLDSCRFHETEMEERKCVNGCSRCASLGPFPRARKLSQSARET